MLEWLIGGHGALIWSASLLTLALVAYVATMLRDHRSATRASAAAPSLAVLSFEVVGVDTANAYFGDGIADEIAIALTKAGGLRVASPTSVAAFRSTHDLGVRELGRRLGVGAVLEGRVRRSGDRMRLTVQLTSVADGLTLWSDVYERQVKDVFRVQDEIARSIAGALRARLPQSPGSLSGRPVWSPGTTNADAYDLYLRGSYMRERRGGGVAKAVEYFERAIAADSGFARAYAGLAYALELGPIFMGTQPRDVDGRAIDVAHRALALDSTLGEAYTAIGLAHQRALRWREAGEALQRSITVDPDYAPGEYHYADYLLRVGRVAEAEEPSRRARVADPLSATASIMLAYTLSLLGRSDDSHAESRRAYELDSSLATVHARLALAVLHDGHREEAHELAVAALPLPFSGSAAYVLGATGDRVRAATAIREFETQPRGEFQLMPALAYAYLGLGDTTRALAALEEAARAGDVPIIPLSDPMFDSVRQSGRFAAVVRRFGLDERRLGAAEGGRPHSPR